MTNLDHTILRVRSTAESIDFYKKIMCFNHIGRAGPFEILRVSPSLTIDLLQEKPKDQVHLAFAFDSAAFHELHARLVSQGIPFGGDVFIRDGRVSKNSFGASGIARAFYFYDPDKHNLEARLYDLEV